MKKNIKPIFFLFIQFFILANSFVLFGQTDTRFWFVAPEITLSHKAGGVDPRTGYVMPGGEPIFFNFTTKELGATVKISMPANLNFPDTTFYIPANTAHLHYLTNYIDEIENRFIQYGGEWGKNNKGILIESSALITVYYESSNMNNPDIFALKGGNALGSDFYVPFQTDKYNKNNASWTVPATSAFDIVATEDGTTITIQVPKRLDNSDIYVMGQEGFSTFTVTLNKGETYTAIPAWKNTPTDNWQTNETAPNPRYGRSEKDHLSGARVTSNKPIAITTKDDSMKSLLDGCYDLAGDQLIPRNIIGKEYIAMRGQLKSTGAVKQERLYIVGTNDGDSIYINGVGMYKINAGQTIMYEMVTPYAHVRSKDSAVYCWQISGFGCEMGGAILPPTDACTGSFDVGFTRSTDQGFYLNIMVRKGAEAYFKVNNAPTSLFTATDFVAVSGDDDWLAARLGPYNIIDFPVNKQTIISNTKDLFHLGIINGDTTGGTRFGYFSNFNVFKVDAFISIAGQQPSQVINICYGESVQLVVNGGNDHVQWSPTLYLNDALSSVPVATPRQSSITYVAEVGAFCGVKDSAHVTIQTSYPFEANFTTDTSQGCAPLDINISHSHQGIKIFNMDLTNGQKYWAKTDSVSYADSTFQWRYENKSDTMQNNRIRLIVVNKHDICNDTLDRYVVVYPEINAKFTVNDTVGCHPHFINFQNQSTGDTATWKWNFGDGDGKFTEHTSHNYVNLGTKDTTFTAQLVALSNFYCTDTARQKITVYPYYNVSFVIDTVDICAPYQFKLENQSVGIDTFFLKFGNNADTILPKSFQYLEKTFVNTTEFADTIIVRLIGKSRYGCTDTMTRTIIVRPTITADYSMSVDQGCDSTEVQFADLSTGYNLKYFWNFDNGATSSKQNPLQLFNNKTLLPVTRKVTLVIENNYFCKDTIVKDYLSKPYINAKFGVDTATSCQPYTININNSSIGVEQYNWDFGDKTPISNTSNASIQHYYSNISYTDDSLYVLRLIAKNTTHGCSDTLEQIIKIYHKIVADFTIDTNRKCHPAEFKFTDKSLGTTNYFWAFGDSATSAEAGTVFHLYPPNNSSTPKTHTITLVAHNQDYACSATKDTTLITNPYVRAEFASGIYADCHPFTAKLTNSSYGLTNTYTWTIDSAVVPGSPTNKGFFFHEYTNPTSPSTKQYIVGLMAVNNEGCIHQYTDTIAVYPRMEANFSTQGEIWSGCHPLTVEFNNFAKDRDSSRNKFQWIFGDGSTSNIVHPAKSFNNFSNIDSFQYNVKLIVTANGCTHDTTKKITVYAKPKASYEINKDNGCADLPISFTNNSITNTESYYIWYFNKDLSVPNDAFIKTTNKNYPTNPEIYTNTTMTPLLYNTKLVVDNKKCTDTATRTIDVYPKVSVDFSVDSLQGCNPLKVNFTNKSSTSASELTWDFGDGKIQKGGDTLLNHTFFNEGLSTQVFNVKLTAKSREGCVNQTNAFENITVFPAPIAQFSSTDYIKTYPDSLFIINDLTRPKGDWIYEWELNNNATTLGSDSILSLNYWGTYNLKLKTQSKVYDKCFSSYLQDFIILPPPPKPAFYHNAPVCLKQPVIVENKSDDITVQSYKWDFNDGTIDTIKDPPEHYYDSAGVYRISLTTYGYGTDNENVKAIYQDVIVYPLPVVDFNNSLDTAILPDAYIKFHNYTYITPFPKLTSDLTYLWNFGDGKTSRNSDPNHLYGPPPETTYSVTLYVTDQTTGCNDSMPKPNLVYIKGAGEVQFPNVFTPSNFGSTGGNTFNMEESDNTVFRPFTKDVIEYHLQIFNRWGELIYETKDQKTGWDGYYRGKMCEQGVYVWKAEVKYSDGRPDIKVGDVTLLIK